MNVTLVSADWSARSRDAVPGFDAAEVERCFFMHDPTVRGWIADQRQAGGENCRVLVADHEWVNPGGYESLTIPLDPRDMAIVEEVRHELKPPPIRHPKH